MSLERRLYTGNGRPLGRPPHKNSKAASLQSGDEVGASTYAQLLRRDRRDVAAAEEVGLERRTSAFAQQRTGASDRARGMGTGIYGATLQWAHIGVMMVVCSWHDALAADQLPQEIVGNWCLAIERMLPETYAYRRCKDSRYHIIVRADGFDAQETSCQVNKIGRQGAAWLASFRCWGAGLIWLEDDQIRVSKDGWTLEAKIKNVRRVGDPIRYCLLNEC